MPESPGFVAHAAPQSAAASLAPSEILRRKIRLVNPRTLSNTPSVLAHPRLGEFYPDLLFLLYSTIRASVPLMQTALEAALQRSSTDAVARDLVPYLATHIEEELNHDEWLLEDMELLGMNRAGILKRLPPPELAAAVGAQFYWVQCYHPVALLGYLVVLEGDPTPHGVVEKAAAEGGLPPAAFRTVLLHSEHDFQHRDELNQVIDRLPLQPHHSAVMSISAMQIAAAYEEAFASILPE
jgi:Iron-containing redox enzyme